MFGVVVFTVCDLQDFTVMVLAVLGVVFTAGVYYDGVFCCLF